MKTFKLLTLAFLAFALGASGANAVGIAPVIGALGGGAIALFTPAAQGSLFTALDVTGLNAALGAYYRDNQEIFWDEVFYNAMMAERFRPVDGVTDEKPIMHSEIDFEILPGHDKTVTNYQTGAIAFGGQLLKTRECKVDLLIYPSQLHRTWLGKYKQKGSDPFDLPLEAYIMNAIAEKAQEKLYLNAAYAGVYNAAGTTTAAVTNGFLKLIADLITATTITPVTTGTITSTNVITAIEAVCGEIEAKYRTVPNWEIKVSDSVFNLYWKKRRDLYPSLIAPYTGNTGLINELPVEGYNVTLKREVGMGASQRMIATPHDNMAWLFDSASDVQNMEIQKFDRGLKVLMDFKAGFGFIRALDGYLVVNDQA
jgi:hypothetical protein